MKQSPWRAFLPIVIIFVLVSAFFITSFSMLEKLEINQALVITGNCILFVVTAASFFLFRNALLAPNTHAFLRNMYSALILKFFVLIIVAFIYIYFTGSALNKAGLLSLVVLYFVYMFSEVALLMNLSRQIRENKNA